jgi:hypothetical protein
MNAAMEVKRIGEEGEVSLTCAQVHPWPTWRGSAHAADQARPEGDFTGGGIAAQGAPIGDASTDVVQPPQPPQ